MKGYEEQNLRENHLIGEALLMQGKFAEAA